MYLVCWAYVADETFILDNSLKVFPAPLKSHVLAYQTDVFVWYFTGKQFNEHMLSESVVLSK